MRPADRVAIHEAMEQQTISIAKAGITTVLNSRAAVLAAANPVFGRYDDFKSASENIDMMTTILSRFDLIFLVRDVREEERDRMICRHVMGVHINSSKSSGGGGGASRADGGDGALAFLSAGPGQDESGEAERYVLGGSNVSMFVWFLFRRRLTDSLTCLVFQQCGRSSIQYGRGNCRKRHESCNYGGW
jgi:DNA replicative helicase MCM subunit Mcm2 (Cdc46/Mcm family)